MTDPKDDNKAISTDISSEQTTESTNEQTPTAPQAAPIKDTKPSGAGSNALTGAAVLIAFAAAGLSGYQYYQSEQTTANYRATLDQLSNQISQNQSSLSSHSNQLNEINGLRQLSGETANQTRQIAQQNKTLESRFDEAVSALSLKINQLGRTSKADWSLAEAEYLIRLANQRLLLDHDISNALALLTSADQILASLKDPLLFATRKAIAGDIQTLKTVSQFDLEGYYLQLSALFDQVAQLPQREPSKQWQQQNAEPTTSDNQSTESSYWAFFTKAWEQLKSLVVINYNQKPITALLPAQDYQQLVTGTQMQLEIAQVALIKGEDTIYQAALSRAASAVATYFDTEAQTTVAFITTLTSLQQVDPTPDIPLPRASLDAMKSLMQQWNTRTLPEVESEVDSSATSNLASESETLPSNEEATQ